MAVLHSVDLVLGDHVSCFGLELGVVVAESRSSWIWGRAPAAIFVLIIACLSRVTHDSQTCSPREETGTSHLKTLKTLKYVIKLTHFEFKLIFDSGSTYNWKNI